MSLRVIGAGWPRTGTFSLKIALERLLGGRCYHMFELMTNPGEVIAWEQALDGDISGVNTMLAGHVSAVDWPVALFWRELLAVNPEAIVVLSKRESAQQWWRSMSATILHVAQDDRDFPGDNGRLRPMLARLQVRGCGSDNFDDVDRVLAAYERSIAAVRAECPKERLVEWTPAQGWAPLCAALDCPVPSEPFPRANSTVQFHENVARLMQGS